MHVAILSVHSPGGVTESTILVLKDDSTGTRPTVHSLAVIALKTIENDSLSYMF